MSRFPFPYEPYSIQVEFMESLYSCLEEGKLGIFESPTGTVFHLIKNHPDAPAQKGNGPEEAKIASTEPIPEVAALDWVQAYRTRRLEEESRAAAEQQQIALQKESKRLAKVRAKRQKLETPEEGEEYLVGDYSSDQDEEDQKGDTETVQVRKVLFCSRTHTQLSQFVHEVKRTAFASELKVVPLSARRHLCIHGEIKRKAGNNSARLDDLCYELVSGPGCVYNQQEKMTAFKDHILADVQDLEELVTLGEKHSTCPYFGARNATPTAELVVVPYASVLHEPTRKALGLELAGNVVVIDEAHNLVDAINEMYSYTISQLQLQQAHAQLFEYLRRYQNRLKGKNIAYIQQILDILHSFLKVFTNPGTGPSKDELMTLNDFSFATNTHNTNLFKIDRYIAKSRIVQKSSGFAVMVSQEGAATRQEKAEKKKAAKTTERRPALGTFHHFLMALVNPNTDGRIVVTNATLPSQSFLKFVLFNPARHFEPLFREAHSVILAGGTLQPVRAMLLQLLGEVPPHVHFSCGHVVPASNLLCLSLTSGPTGLPLNFTFESRGSPATMSELGRVIANQCAVVPDGMVVFFPSYAYEEQVLSHWQASGVLAQISSKKYVFREPRDAGQSEQLLEDYGRAIRQNTNQPGQPHGAVLFAVVGGKLSEGINFSDEKARLVVIAGMPYPNPHDVLVKERLNFFKARAGEEAAQAYLDDACMKAVNQSIADYAAIVLADARYSRPHILQRLPGWLRELASVATFPQATAQLAAFVGRHRDEQQRLYRDRAGLN